MAKKDSLGAVHDNLRWIIRYSEGIASYITYFGKDFEIFADSELYQDACYSKINQITQCLDRIAMKDPEFFEMNFSFSIGSIKGIRNIISHQYENVDNRIVWSSSPKKSPPGNRMHAKHWTRLKMSKSQVMISAMIPPINEYGGPLPLISSPPEYICVMIQ